MGSLLTNNQTQSPVKPILKAGHWTRTSPLRLLMVFKEMLNSLLHNMFPALKLTKGELPLMLQ